ncbi:MAG: hypothetical protein HUK06_08895 [Bacteroidaceae bacterium]|nr:hypothetical protein [Bacteroidaceae bacterium]
MAENVAVVAGSSPQVATSPGSAGLKTQAPGSASTVGNLAGASGGVDAGNLVEVDIDEELFRFQSEDTALMSLMLKAKKRKVQSPEVDHYMIDEQRSTLTVETAVAQGSGNSFKLPLVANDREIPREHHTLLVKGVNGWNEDGSAETPGRDLMLFVTGRDTDGSPICRAVNGKRASAQAQCSTPAIPANSKVILLANAMYETQKEVDPDLIIPQPTRIYLQKRGMNQIVSDYFDAQKKRIPFTQATIAEQAILNFKRAGNRTLWAGRKSKFVVNVPKLGQQSIYTMEGVRWQFKKELQHTGKWTIEKLIALAKMFYTGEDVPKSALLLAGKNLLEEIQCIDFTKHPEVQMAAARNETLGWAVTRIHTVFGDIDIKREPTLDTLGWSNSGALIGEDRIVHYSYSTQHEFNDRVEGEEATRKGIVVWDGIALKGSCHIWIDGEGDEANAGATSYMMWEKDTAPTGADLIDGMVYYLVNDCPGINAAAQNGTMWKASVNSGTATWTEFAGEIFASD